MSNKQVIQLTPNGYFMGFTVADESPLEPGHYLMPAHCIEAEPPVEREGYVYRWSGSGWDELSDIRGTRYWTPDGKEWVIDQVGMVLPDDALFENPRPFDAPTVPPAISRRQCAVQLLVIGMISSEEAISMAQSGIPPASVQADIDKLPEPQRTMAIIDFSAIDYFRDNPLVATLAALHNMGEEDIDQFFIAASKL